MNEWKNECEIGIVTIDWTRRRLFIEGLEGPGMEPIEPEEVLARLDTASADKLVLAVVVFTEESPVQLALYNKEAFLEYVWGPAEEDNNDP